MYKTNDKIIYESLTSVLKCSVIEKTYGWRDEIPLRERFRAIPTTDDDVLSSKNARNLSVDFLRRRDCDKNYDFANDINITILLSRASKNGMWETTNRAKHIILF